MKRLFWPLFWIVFAALGIGIALSFGAHQQLVESAAEHGGGHGEHASHAIDWFVYLSTAMNFWMMVGLLTYGVSGWASNQLVQRRENMAQQLREAREKQQIAEQRIAEYAHKLEHLEEEVQNIVTSFEKEAAADRERLSQDTDRAIERLARENDFTIRQEMRKAEKAIREAAVKATLETAEELIKSRITEADQRRLADAYIANLERGGKPN